MISAICDWKYWTLLLNPESEQRMLQQATTNCALMLILGHVKCSAVASKAINIQQGVEEEQSVS